MVIGGGGLSLRISLTESCQLRCQYCLPIGCPTTGAEALSSDEIVRFVRAIRDNVGVGKVHLTGGEPLLRGDIVELVEQLTELAVPDLALTTNAQLLGHLAQPLWKAGLRRINVSLDSIDDRRFADMTRGGRLSASLEGIYQALKCGMTIQTNTVVIRGQNEAEICQIAAWGAGQGIAVRFLELMPIGPARSMFADWHVPAEEILERLRDHYELQPIGSQGGGTTRWFEARRMSGGSAVAGMSDDGGAGVARVGLIASTSHPFCEGCRRLRLTSDGQLVGCLAIGRGVGIRHLLQDYGCVAGQSQQLMLQVAAALRMKRCGGKFETVKLMTQTGG